MVSRWCGTFYNSTAGTRKICAKYENGLKSLLMLISSSIKCGWHSMSNITLCRLWERFLTKIGIRSSIMLISAIQRQEFTLVACKRGMCLMSMRHFLEAISDHTLRDHAQCNKVRQCKVGLAWPLLSNVIWLFHYSFFPFILNASWLTDLCRFGHPSHRNPHAW
jgi:hypothetical protein